MPTMPTRRPIAAPSTLSAFAAARRGALAILGTALLLAACGTTPKASLYTLDDGRPGGQGNGPSVLLLSASLPELLDRPQLVLRGPDQRILLSEQQRWAEPLRSGIARSIAADLGRLLASSRVAALPNGAPHFDADFRLTLHVQRLEAQVGRGVDLDLLWTLQPRQGKELLGRSQVHEPLAAGSETMTGDGGAAALVAAQRRALSQAAAEIAAAIQRQPLPAAAQ